MIPSNPGDVVLVRFPFTDLSSTKQRPAVVISPSVFSAKYADIVVMAVTGKDPLEPTLALQDWRTAGLLKPTWFKPLIATLSATLVVKRCGVLAEADRSRLAQVLKGLIDLSFR